MTMQQKIIGTLSDQEMLAAEEKRRRDRSSEQIEKEAESRKQRSLQTIARNDPIKIEYPDFPIGAQKVLRDSFPNREIVYENNHLIFKGLTLGMKTKLFKIPLPEEHKKKFFAILENVYKQMEKRYEEIQQQGRDRVKEAENFVTFHTEAHKELDNHLSKMHRDKRLQAEHKRKPPRVFSDEEKQKLINCQAYSQEDLERSRSNLTEKKTKLLKQLKDCEKAISQLEAEKKPFDEKATELREKLDHDE